MMKRDLIVFEHERFELTGYDVWMTAGEIASLLGVTIMKVRSIINRMRSQLAVNLDLISKYDLLESGYKDELYNLAPHERWHSTFYLLTYPRTSALAKRQTAAQFSLRALFPAPPLFGVLHQTNSY